MPDRTGEPGSPKAAFNIVGIGASAGGVEALSELLAGLPAAPALAFLLVQHRDPTYPSLLVELLSRRSRMPVVEAHDGMVFEVDHIYVVPATCTVTAIDSAVRLHRYESAEQRRRPIDSMFRSLAASRGQSSIGVVLSGTDSDGTLGIEEIKGVGGITFAQEPGSAKFDSMPRKAIATGCVDFMLTPKEIAEKILEVGRHPYMNGVVAPDDQPFSEEENLRKIFRILRAQAHVDFSQYKRNTIERRLGRRMALRHIEKLAQYAELLHGDRVEIDALVQDFLIRVTGFFRDPEAFKSLSDSVFPQLLENRARKEPLRIWVPGCAGGQEVYSIAILLMEFLADHPAAIPIQIFGTDLSEIAIRQARAGEYVANIEEEVSNERLRRFFVKLDDHYQVVKSLRELCIFTRHNVTYDPPFSRIDLICCRNVLIYFELNLQRQVIRSFHYALKPGGFLQLAPSESISQDAELFQLMDARHRLYRKQALASEVAPEPHPVTQAATPSTIGRIEQMSTVPDQPRAQREIERRLLARYAPAAVLIDPDLSIVYFQGETSLYLEHARGAASLDLRKVVRPALLIEVSSALEQARREDTPARREHIHFEVSGKDRSVNIEVAPLKLPDSEATFFAILFEQAAPPAEPSDEHPFARWLEAFRHRKGDSESEKDRRIQQLQREIQAARDYQQTAIEEYQAAQEELKAAHEEALSINEEFQSTNEELETAKEELQSSNEELTTTNEELRNRNRELNEMNEKLRESRDHLNAIIETLREPFLVLDAQLKVLQANRAFYECFLTSRAEVEGRHIYELGDRQWDFPLLRRVLEDIIPKETELRDFEMTHAFPSIGTKTMRLNASKVTGAGRILLAFEDVTERAKALEDIKEANRQKDQFLAMLSHELRNPLAPIVNALRIMRLSGGLNPVGERARAVIERQVGQMTRLMSDLLEVARVTNGTILLYKKKTELKPMIERAIETARPTIDQRQHRLSVSVPSEPVWLNVDAARLEQVLVNLLTNAAKYTDPGGHIDLRAVAERDDSVTIFLSDTGIGMDSDLLPHVFEIFAQSPRSLARSQGGLGIGLSVARNLVELHGGTIEAHSEGPGKGSEFIVRLPRSNPHEVQREAAPREAARAPKDEPRRVLIVDDSADTTASAAELFADFGHDVRIASSGSEALEMAAQYRPDVILLDIGLPGMNGYEVADRLRQDARFKDVLMIAISGYGQESDRQRSLAAGFDEHLVKPVDLEKLEELLTEKINLKRAAG